MMKCHFLRYQRHCGRYALTMLAGTVRAESTGAKYGADDTIGALNELNPEDCSASGLVKLGKTYALGVETGPDSPAYSPRNYNVPCSAR